jgi:hypothetical protein
MCDSGPRGVENAVSNADRVRMASKRLRSPYMGLVASLLGFVLGGVTYLRGSR